MIKSLLIFSFGAVTGGAASYLYWKNYYERWAQNEINTMRDYFNAQEDTTQEDIPEEEPAVKDTETRVNNMPESDITKENMIPEMMEYAKKITSMGYTNYSNKKQGGEDMKEKPYIIPPEDFGELYDYDCITLTFEANGTLTDEMGGVVDYFEEIVGSDFAAHFGEYEDDVVYIRNDRLRCDYEILKTIDPC